MQKFNVFYNDIIIYVGTPHKRTLEDYFSRYGMTQLEMDVDADFNTPLNKLVEMGFDLRGRPTIFYISNPFELVANEYGDKPISGFSKWVEDNYSGKDTEMVQILEDIDYPIREEYLDFDLKNTCHRIGIEYEKFTVSRPQLKIHYSRYYDADSEAKVYSYYEDIISQFNFKVEQPKTLCSTAESALRTLTDATCQICCMNTQTIRDTDGRMFDVEKDDIETIWNSASRMEVVESLRNGVRHSSCQKCWDEEDAGLISKRMRDNRYNGIDTSERFDFPVNYEFNLGTVCNIKCRTCGPWSSSKWLDEYFNTGLAEIDKRREDVPDFQKVITGYSKKYKDDSKFWPEIRKHISEVRHIDFYGGEPFLVKNQWKLLEYAIEKGYSDNISVHYNTNGTLWDKKKIEILDQFKKIKIDFSIDGINDRFEYMRHPAKWKTVSSHLLDAVSKYHDDIAICHTISILNIFYVDEMLDWAEQNGVQIYLNLVHGPQWYNIKNIPESVKKVITDKLSNNVHNKMTGWFPLSGVLDFMNSVECNQKHWEKFKLVTASVDHNRNENFKTVFPEFFEVIKQHGEW